MKKLFVLIKKCVGFLISKVNNLSFIRKLLFNINIYKLGFKLKHSSGFLQVYNENQQIYLRKNTSDIRVFEQIFIHDEYRIIFDFLNINGGKISTILDIGSNIGLSSLKFLNQYPDSKIICVEPDRDNFVQLKLNVGSTYHNAIFLQNALWDQRDRVYLINDFRDGLEWSRRTNNIKSEYSYDIVDAITMKDIIREFEIPQVDLLKLDIEGSECKIFNTASDVSFLKITKYLLIEIHDECNCRKDIYTVLKKYNFLLFNFGQITFGINNNLYP